MKTEGMDSIIAVVLRIFGLLSVYSRMPSACALDLMNSVARR